MNKRRKNNIRKLYKKRIKQYIDLGIHIDKCIEECYKEKKSMEIGLKSIIDKKYQTDDIKVIIDPTIHLDRREYERDPETNEFKRVEYGFFSGKRYVVK